MWCQPYNPHSAEFRLREEIPAHRAEYAHVCEHIEGERARAKALHLIADRLSSPLYGGLLTYAEARNVVGTNEPMPLWL